MHPSAWTRRPGVLNLAIEALGASAMLLWLCGAHALGQRLAGPDTPMFAAVYTLEFTLGLFGLFLLFTPYPRAYFNPAIAIARAIQGTSGWKEGLALSLVQCGGAVTALCLLRWVPPSLLALPTTIPTVARVGPLSEFVAIFALVMLCASLEHLSILRRATAVAVFGGLAFWVAGVPSFANVAISVSWILDGHGAEGGPVLAAQAMGVLSASLLARWLFQPLPAPKPE